MGVEPNRRDPVASARPLIALSTSYYTLQEKELAGEALACEAAELGYRALELDYRLTEAQLKALERRIARGALTAVSVHHPIPRDPAISPFEAHSDRVSLAGLDPEERRLAVRLGSESIARAAGLGAGVVVFHVGKVALAEEVDPRELNRLVDVGKRNTAHYEERKARLAAARESASRPHLEALLSSLDRLCGAAQKRGVALGIENRYHPEQIPDRQELELLLRELRGAPIGYWHDTGHAESLRTLGFLSSQTELLDAFGERLLGFHLHDADGLEDHRAPGAGKVDFASLAPFVKPETVLVLEIHPPASPEVVARAPAALAEAGFPVLRPPT